MSIPVYVSIANSVTVEIAAKRLSGSLMGDEIGIELREEKGRAILQEPFNDTTVSMGFDGLNAACIVVNPEGVHILGNYSRAKLAAFCCVELCGTTACGVSACVKRGKTEVCCGDVPQPA